VGVERLKGLSEPVRVIEVVPERALPPVPVSRWASLRRLRRKHVTRRKAWVVAGTAIVAALAATLAVAALGDTRANAEAPTRVALAGPFRPGDQSSIAAQSAKGYYEPSAHSISRRRRSASTSSTLHPKPSSECERGSMTATSTSSSGPVEARSPKL
jgi:hypothetical protein